MSRLTDFAGTYRLIEQIAVDHVATLRWIQRQAPAEWNDELQRRLDLALGMAETFENNCQWCGLNTRHAAGSNGWICLECGQPNPMHPPF